MATEADGPVTHWTGHLKQGDHSAAQPPRERDFDRLVRLARGKLLGGRSRAADEEDVAPSAFDSSCRAAADGRFPMLEDRDDPWKLLVALTARKAVNLRKHSGREKRGGGRVLDEAALVRPGFRVDAEGLDAAIGDEPAPELAAAVAEECRALLDVLDHEDPTSTLRRVAVWRPVGYTNDEIPDNLACALRTVAKRRALIRSLWAGSCGP